MPERPTTENAPVVVAMDGPAGSGKSSVAKAVARRLGYAYLDTGAAYRALAWRMLRAETDTDDAAAVTSAAEDARLELPTDPDAQRVRVDGDDVTDAIREPRISAAVSAVARVPAVRQLLNDRFRAVMADAAPGIVAEGRDITTVVAPDAPARVLLTASAEVRAARRGAELQASAADAAGAAEALHRRDAADSTVVDFHNAAEGVVVVDSTHLNLDQTVEAVVTVIERAIARQTGERDAR